MSDHQFNVLVAKDYDVETATFLNNLAYWTTQMRATHAVCHEKHYFEGRYWLFNSYTDWSILFPYFSPKQMRRIISNAYENDLIIKGNFNQKGYDNTNWYSLTDKALEYYPILKEQLLNTPAQTGKTPAQTGKTPAQTGKTPAQTGRPIPNSNLISNLNEKSVGDADASTAHTPKSNLKTLRQEKAEQTAIASEEAKNIFDARFEGRVVTMKEIFDGCKEHYEQKSLWATKDRFVKWLKREEPENYPKIDSNAGKKSNLPKHHLEYSSYLSQHRNDKFLKLIPQDAVALEYNEWVSKQENNAKKSSSM